jgi:hypothetical protein
LTKRNVAIIIPASIIVVDRAVPTYEKENVKRNINGRPMLAATICSFEYISALSHISKNCTLKAFAQTKNTDTSNNLRAMFT